MTYLSSGIVGLAGLVLMGVQANQAQAATTGTVNYTDGATTVWTSPEVGQQPKRYLANNQQVNIESTKTVYGQTWYNLGNNEWVSSQFINADGTAKAAATTTSTVKDTVTANYKSGATTVWADTTASQPTGQYLVYGSTKNVINKKVANGTTWYQLESKGWVPASYVVVNNPSLVNVTPITDAPAVKTIAASTPAVATTTPTATTNSAATTAPATTQATTPAATQTSTPAQSSSATSTTATTQSQAPAASTSSVASQSQSQTVATSQSTTQTQSTASTQQSQNTATTNTQQTNNSTSQATGSTSTVVNAALSQIGTPYVWGGSQPGVGLDCSGLVQYAYAQAGKSLGRVTTAQEGAGQRVSLNNLQPGDILFWGGSGASYHDAIYIGGGQYVHAPQPGESVKIGTISSYFMPSFAVRVF